MGGRHRGGGPGSGRNVRQVAHAMFTTPRLQIALVVFALSTLTVELFAPESWVWPGYVVLGVLFARYLGTHLD